jgi:hypothetical protein
MNDESASVNELANDGDPTLQARSRTLKGGLDAAEMGRRSGQVRREKKRKREKAAEAAALTSRQKAGIALASRTQKDWDDLVMALWHGALAGKTPAVNALVRLLDQAYGRPTEAEPDAPSDGLEGMTAAELAAERARVRAVIELLEKQGKLQTVEGSDGVCA